MIYGAVKLKVVMPNKDRKMRSIQLTPSEFRAVREGVCQGACLLAGLLGIRAYVFLFRMNKFPNCEPEIKIPVGKYVRTAEYITGFRERFYGLLYWFLHDMDFRNDTGKQTVKCQF